MVAAASPRLSSTGLQHLREVRTAPVGRLSSQRRLLAAPAAGGLELLVPACHWGPGFSGGSLFSSACSPTAARNCKREEASSSSSHGEARPAHPPNKARWWFWRLKVGHSQIQMEAGKASVNPGYPSKIGVLD